MENIVIRARKIMAIKKVSDILFVNINFIQPTINYFKQLIILPRNLYGVFD